MPSTKKSQVKSGKKYSASVKKKSGSAGKWRTSVQDSESEKGTPATSLNVELQERLLSLKFQVQVLYAQCSKLKGTSAQKNCRIDANNQVMKHFVQLMEESKTLKILKLKMKTGAFLSEREKFMLQALRCKTHATKAAAVELKEADTALTSAIQHQQTLHRFADQSSAVTSGQSRVLHEADLQVSSGVANAKKTPLTKLQQEWVIGSILAAAAASLISWTAHRAFVNTADASTAMLQEAVKLSHTVESLTQMIQATSKEAAKWSVTGLGEAVGAANGLLFSSFLPNRIAGSKAASVLSAAAVGALAGARLLLA